MKDILIHNNLLYKIDIHFADYICKCQDSDSEMLWLLAAMVSYFVNQGDSAFSTQAVNKKPLGKIFPIETGTDEGEHATLKKIVVLEFPELDLNELLNHDIVIGQPGELKPIIFDSKLFYLNKLYQYELTVADFIRNHAENFNDISGMKKEINDLFTDNYIEKTTLINYQKVAAMMALRSGFLIISGGPGTGKTHTVGKILTLLIEQNPDIIIKLVAPTGKAAERLNKSIKLFKKKSEKLVDKKILDAIPETAETIHKFMGINSYRLKYDKYSPAPIDLLVIDEASMVSLPVFAKTFEALSKNCRVILLGDKDQLMAVENGNVLQNMTDSKTLNAFSANFADCVAGLTNHQIKLETVNTPAMIEDSAIQLEHSRRFKKNSGIGHLSRAVNMSDINTTSEELQELFDKYDDISFVEKSSKDEIKKYIESFCMEHLENYKKALKEGDIGKIMESMSKFRILCAVNDGPFGVNDINELIEKTLLKKKSADTFYHGRPVLITVNDYKLKLMNGDVGVIAKDSNGELQAYFPGVNKDKDKDEVNEESPDSKESFHEFNPASLGEHKTAFTISIHKSQGSEYENVFIILPPKENKILTKELIYTAVTRAKEKCTVVASPAIFHKASITKMVRQSGLKSKLEK